jgi:hypothetical protein
MALNLDPNIGQNQDAQKQIAGVTKCQVVGEKTPVLRSMSYLSNSYVSHALGDAVTYEEPATRKASDS